MVEWIPRGMLHVLKIVYGPFDGISHDGKDPSTSVTAGSVDKEGGCFMEDGGGYGIDDVGGE